MKRILSLRAGVIIVLAGLCVAPVAQAATAARETAPAAVPFDLFTITGTKVDATAESATAARDLAMAQGRPLAWSKLFRRFTAPALWSKQPVLAENQLLRLIRSFEVGNERRSTTRYLADVTFHFNAPAVRALLRQYGIAFTETRSRPALVIPIVTGSNFEPNSAWAMAWNEPSLQQGLVPMILPQGDTADLAVLLRSDLAQLDWAGFAPLVRRYNAASVVLALAGEDAKSVQVIQIAATGRTAATLAFAQSNFTADAEAVADKIAEVWKTRSAVNYAQSAHLIADVNFDSTEEWARIRTQLGAVRAISDMDVVGIALHEAEIDLTYFGRPEQLRDALAQQSLELAGNAGNYTLQLAGAAVAGSSANSP